MRDDLAALDVPQQIHDRFARYAQDPVGFVRDVLGAESATRRDTGAPYQYDILRDLSDYPRVCVRSGHGIGKSAIDAWAALWWLLTRPMSRVVVVAPEFSRQVRAVLFSEMRKWVRNAKEPLPVTVLASRCMVEGYGEEWCAIGMPATEPSRIEGFHSEAGVLLVLDETKGIPQDTYDALQGALSGLNQNRLLVTSTPGGPSGPFYRIWSRGADRWRLHHIPSTESSLVSDDWIEDRRNDWGEGSPLFEARVLGNFPDSGEGVLFPLSLLEASALQDVTAEKSTQVILGVDVARSIAGDMNCIAVRRGHVLEDLITWRSADTMSVVEKVVQVAATRGASLTYVDVTGVGAGVADRLRQLRHRVTEVHFGGAAQDPKRFKNKRAEMFWTLRERLERKESTLCDDELIADLSALRYYFTADGRIQLESKDESRRRLGRSPDRADAVALAYSDTATGVSVESIRYAIHAYRRAQARIRR